MSTIEELQEKARLAWEAHEKIKLARQNRRYDLLKKLESTLDDEFAIDQDKAKLEMDQTRSDLAKAQSVARVANAKQRLPYPEGFPVES